MTQLGYFTIDTPDLDKARAFYGALFGWTFDPESTGPTYGHVADSDPPFGITKGERKDFAHLYFRVDDIAAVCARVTELGGKANLPSQSASGLSVAVSDDQGVAFGLWQPAPGL